MAEPPDRGNPSSSCIFALTSSVPRSLWSDCLRSGCRGANLIASLHTAPDDSPLLRTNDTRPKPPRHATRVTDSSRDRAHAAVLARPPTIKPGPEPDHQEEPSWETHPVLWRVA